MKSVNVLKLTVFVLTKTPSGRLLLLSSAIFSRVLRALSSSPIAKWYLALSGSQKHNIPKMNRGIEVNPSRYRQPKVGMTIIANATSTPAPIGQNKLKNVDVLARAFLGENSENTYKRKHL